MWIEFDIQGMNEFLSAIGGNFGFYFGGSLITFVGNIKSKNKKIKHWFARCFLKVNVATVINQKKISYSFFLKIL